MRRESRVFWPFMTWGAALVLLWPAGSVQGAQEPTQAAEPAPVPAKTAGQEMAKTATAGADGKAPVATPTLADLAWLEGQWQGKWGPRVAEQTWMAPKAGIMTGLFRLVEGDKTLVLEMFTVVEKPDGINFYFRHFTPELVPWEKGDATLLNLSSSDAKKIEFVNPVNGQPKRAILLRVDAGTYISRSEIVPDQGDMQVIEITYHRVNPPPPEKPNAKNGGRR